MANESQKMKSILRDAGIALALLVLILVFAITAENFLAPANITNILTQVTINLILATGMTFVILIGGIDLSVGSILALCAVVGGTVMNLSGLDVVSAVLLATVVSILVGIACGMANGLISAYWGIPSFIVTLGMFNVARGAALQFTHAQPIYSFPPELINFGEAAISFYYFSIPLTFIVALILVLVAWFILTKTVFGRLLYAIGNNEEAVRLAGHPVFWYKVAAFTIAGGIVGIGAIIYIARLSIASPNGGTGYELNAIAAVIIGGTSLNGGRGSVFGTLVGAIIISVLANGLVLLGLGDFIRQMITGLVIILAVVLDKYRERLAR
ncbi:ABC transporter permease [Bartonella sp. HY329]|uniref:ABC transporter permease n=1 Tax=unclassified Bartonella TaxID=2645622 RepID=UPI0021C871B7|nr:MULTISPECIES: ABC transporter permease [unclassified Bartonella]UXM95593.1 ABC transporter permease [Bartonella sp. HY329]UXN09918.1 ABC transporter permease [Bartonella sp. HY328]